MGFTKETKINQKNQRDNLLHKIHGRITLVRRRPKLDSAMLLSSTNQAKSPTQFLQDTLLLSTNQKPSKAQEREQKDEEK